ncbi:hydrophobic/amphiphilic exporter-1, HAE1 family [Virgibacillus subterraneus]|uniref:Hydrophobic/amphiphilic exporter-1, HAE1 family n=1 Tax=Virgibacillus subterraneus TaxID=621109 RepID=A0A1H9AD87_9BACI|nr:efflux RND transporter permease subunit [Virgibacillus subterraneus]SEP74403.1 hydrophobic/amphiphilic exporter-1, HAE1 family [Virgibacillus subterraneus]
MKLVNTSVKRPVGVIMIVLAIIALGIVSVRSLTVDLFPKIDLPVAVVATSYGDAAPQEVENLISRPIESSVSSVEGIQTVQSQSQSGSSLVIMMFNNGVDLDQALLDVREKVDQAKGFLPEEAGEPSVMRFSPDQLPVMWVGLTGDDSATLTQVAEDEVVPFFERQGGVASVTVEGAKEREIQLILDQAKLQQYGVSAQMITQSLNSSNQSASVGAVEKGNKKLQLRVTGEFESVEEIKQTFVQTQSGGKVYIDEVAEVKDTYKKSSTETLVNGEPSVVLSIMKKTDGNTVEVATNIKESMEEIKGELPPDANLDVIIDTSEFIEMSISSVVKNILIGGIISIFILLLFLKSVRATIVIGLSIPIAIISTFTLMYFTGETLNVLTLGGLALGLGMMVDSSIVILENIYSYRKKGYSIMESATKGASELAPAVIASTTTTLVVFLPIIYVEGIASDMFTPLALAVSFSLIASLVVAVTLVPMLSSKLLTKAMEDKGRRYWFDRFLDRVNNGYRSVLRWVLKHRKTTVFGTIIAIAGSLALTPLIGAEFIPSSDQGQMEIRVEAAPGSSLEHTQGIVDQINEQLTEYDDVIETNYVSVGGGGFGAMAASGNQATYTMQLIPSTDRSKTTKDIVQEIDEDVQSIPGAEITVNATDSGMGMGDPVQIQLKGPEHEVLRELSSRVVDEISTVDGVYNPTSAAEDGIPQMTIEVDEEKAAAYGLNQQQIISQIQLQFTGQVASKYREEGHEMNVKLMFPEDERSTINDLQDMKIQSQSGASIPLDSVVTFKEVQGPVTLLRENQQPQMNITSEIVDRDLGSITTDIEAELEGINLPEGYSYKIGGQAQDMAESFTDLSIALIFSIFLVYAVMAVQFENFLFPLIIMFSMPATVVGVMVGLFVTGLPLSIPAFIGIIMLAGIVVNNSIVLVDYINILRRNGKDRYEAILQAGPSRLRPILMTTLTTVLAMVPLALALGEGAEMQQPLAVTIIFGLGISSIFTLLLIPVVYTLFDDLTAKIVRRKNKPA